MENEADQSILEVVPSYDSTLSDEETISPPAKNSRTEYNWVYDQTFDSISEAMTQIESEVTWSRSRTHFVDVGQKIYFRCNKVLSRTKPCSAALYLLLETSSNAVLCFRTSNEHDHESSLRPAKFVGISAAVKSEILGLFNQQMKPKAILLNLAERGHAVPSQRQRHG